MCEYPEFINHTDQRARKPHRCCECGIIIGIGETYHRVTGKWSGEVDTYIQCGPCATLWDWLNSEVECLSYGMLWEGITDNDMMHHVPRAMLSHRFLMWIHEQEIEDAENEPEDGVEIVPVADQRLVGLMRVHDENSNPHLWKRYQQRLLERAANAGSDIWYHRQELAKGSRYPEYHLEQLAKPAV